MSEFGGHEGIPGETDAFHSGPGHEDFGLGSSSHEPGLSVSEDHFDSWHLASSEASANPNEIGNPNEYEQDWFFQHYNGYCMPSSITQVIEAQSGEHIHSYDLVEREAAKLGLPRTEFTMEQGQELLENLGVPCHVVTAGNPTTAIDDLANYLHEGRSIVLAVNASPIWYGSPDVGNPSGDADHALVVSAVNAQTGEVTLSDPGSPTGNEETVPIDTFMQAWSASDYQMLVTDHAAGTDAQPVQTDIAHLEPGSGFDIGHIAHDVEHDAFAGSVLLPIALGAGALTSRAVRSRRPKPHTA